MRITIAGTAFNESEYDARGDVLYLSAGQPREASRTVATSEGRAIDYDETGAVIGLVLVNVRQILEREGAVTLTRPAERLEADQLQAALSSAA